MTLLGAISRTALKTFQPKNRVMLRQTPNYVSIRLLNIFEKISKDAQNKAPERPKRPGSGYNIYYKQQFLKLNAENPDLKVKDLAKTIANQWNHLDPNVKQEMMEIGKKNNEEYKQQFQKWQNSLSDTQKENYLIETQSRRKSLARRRLKVELKLLEFPNRPKSAFNLYIKETIENRDKSDEPYKQTFKRIVEKWNTLSDEERVPFIESAKNDKMRYLQELSQWTENLKSDENKAKLDHLTKLRTLSSKGSLNSDLQKQKTKKKPKAKKLTAKKTTKSKTKAKPKVKSKSRKVTKSKTAKKTTKSSESVKKSKVLKEKTKINKKDAEEDSSSSE